MLYPLDTGYKLKVHTTFRKYPGPFRTSYGHSIYALCPGGKKLRFAQIMELLHPGLFLIVSATRRWDINAVVSVGPRAEKLNIASNDHGRTRKCDFTVLGRKCLFRQIWSKNSKLSLSWNCGVHFLCIRLEIPFLSRFGPKNQ